jgi:integrase
MARRTGQIKRIKNGKWQARVQWVNANGKRQSIAKNCASRAEADAELEQILADLQKAFAAPFAVKTFNELFDAYLEIIRPTVKEQTYYLYERIIKSYLRGEFGALPIDALDVFTLEKFYVSLQKKYAPETIFKIHTQLKSALRRARLWKWVSDNPAEYVKPPKRAKSAKDTLTVEELNAFFAACPDNRSRAMWTFFALTGGRASEVLAARWRDIDFTAKTFRVEQVLIQTKQVKRFDVPKTTHSRRTIPLSDDLLLILKKHKTEQNIERLKTGDKWQDNDLVFPYRSGKPQRLSNIGEKCTLIATAAGIVKKVHPHLFRHTWATLSLQAGVNIKVLSGILGHASVKISLDVYSHINLSDKSEAIGRMSDLILKNG